MEMAPGRSVDKQLQYSRKEVFLIIKEHWKYELTTIIEHLERNISEKSGYSVHIREDMKASFSILFHKMKIMCQKANRTEEKFFQKNKEWLNAPVFFPVLASPKAPTNKRGRRSTDFTFCSERSKRRKTEDIRATLTSNELAYAAQMSLRAERQLDASKVVKKVTLMSPSIASKYRKAFQSTTESTLSEDAALSVLVEYKFSKSQYQGQISEQGKSLQIVSFLQESKKSLLSTSYGFSYYRK